MVTALSTPDVQSGHVAGWVGVGAPGEGPGGTDEWIQVGLNGLPGTGNALYYEVMQPGTGVTYTELATDVPTGRNFRVAVLETASTPGTWRVWVDGRPVSAPLALTGGEHLTPMAMGESWDGGRPACNQYSYRFARVSIAAAPGGSWARAGDSTVLQDPGYRVVQRTTATFDAGAAGLLPVQPVNRPTARVLASASKPAAKHRRPAKRP